MILLLGLSWGAVRAEEAVSIYDLKAELTDQEGASVALDLWRGHPLILSMFYTQCAYVCPALVSRIQGIEKQLAPEERARLRVLLISFDPDRDTPSVLKEKMRALGVDAGRWTMARAPEAKVREIAAVLGFLYKRLPSGDFNHSTSITLLDPGGVVISTLDSLNADPAPLLEAFRKLN